ncbi:P2 family phage major capsid protein [Serratia ureilytica]|uniref:P2 family phage major capsid protein n=1 Tax=Serratia ureilytica TaxID=300181 RepID=UPI00371A20FC
MEYTSITDLLEKYDQRFTDELDPLGNNGTFTLPESAEMGFRLSLLESSWMMQNITLLDVVPDDGEKGQAIYVGASDLHTGRSVGGRFYKELDVDGTPYVLAETDTCASLPYDRMSLLANVYGMKEFNAAIDSFFSEAIGLDMLRIGFNGTRASVSTDPKTNPRGEDVNKGWHALAKDFEGGKQVVTEALTLGKGGDFPHLDALANHLVSKIPERLREHPRLTVLVGAELAAHERLRLFNSADRPADVSAAQMAVSSLAGRFAFVPPFMPGKRLAVTTLDNLHIYTMKRSRWIRSQFVEDRRAYERSYLRNEGYALGDGYLYAAVDESAITLKSGD